MKYNIITHITTACNYDCTYCDVIKDKRKLSTQYREDILDFIKNNHNSINRFKFFGGEPLLAFQDMKYIINNSYKYIEKNYEIVTNTTLLNDEVGEYFRDYFSIIFFSIDTENTFNYTKVLKFVKKYNLEKKLYFNLIINPGEEEQSLQQFQKLYDLGMRGFNILPVYFTKGWSDESLTSLSRIMKYILNLSIDDETLRLYGFQENIGEETSLANNTIFIDVDTQVYYSDMSSTFLGERIKNKLHLDKIQDIELIQTKYNDFSKQKKAISELEKYIYNSVEGQKKLHKIMDYFSKYLNEKDGK